MARHLLLHLQAPLASFGAEAIDSRGVIREFPALSMVTGLIANALGWDRADDAAHNRLQARLCLGVLLYRPSRMLTDFQTAQLGADDKGWTTSGRVEARAGGAASYDSPHLRYRDYHTDLDAAVILRLRPAEEAPSLDDVASALDRPQRPLFLGRKPCLPTSRLFDGWLEANDMVEALRAVAVKRGGGSFRAQWTDGDGEPVPGAVKIVLSDERNWTSGLHGGWRSVWQAALIGEVTQ